MPDEVMKNPLKAFDVKVFLAKAGIGKSVIPFRRDAAIFAQGMPVALLTNGTVREARGLTSIT